MAVGFKSGLFEHEKMYKPIWKKPKEADPKSMGKRKSFWRRMCQPDIILITGGMDYEA